ncbi:MAG: triose-phosphate isomerase [Deinococcaceae bacterium]
MECLLALNWKMNKTPSEAAQWAKLLQEEMPQTDVQVAVMAPHITLPLVAAEMYGSTAHLGAQDVSPHDWGAYTGETSALQLKELDVRYVIVGHSERRTYQNETDTLVAQKAKKAIGHGIIPIICVGEALEIRNQNEHIAFTLNALQGSLQGVDIVHPTDLVIAYEPVWAIGTGKTATPEDAEEMSAAIREFLRERFLNGQDVPVLYGGSVNPQNIREICDQANVNGCLVGGASLDLETVFAMVKAL